MDVPACANNAISAMCKGNAISRMCKETEGSFTNKMSTAAMVAAPNEMQEPKEPVAESHGCQSQSPTSQSKSQQIAPNLVAESTSDTQTLTAAMVAAMANQNDEVVDRYPNGKPNPIMLVPMHTHSQQSRHCKMRDMVYSNLPHWRKCSRSMKMDCPKEAQSSRLGGPSPCKSVSKCGTKSTPAVPSIECATVLGGPPMPKQYVMEVETMQQALNKVLEAFNDDDGYVEPQEANSLPNSQQNQFMYLNDEFEHVPDK